MIIDVHAHALSERFLSDLKKNPVSGLTSEFDGKGGFLIRRRGGAPQSLDCNLHNLERRLESLRRRKVSLQFFGPSPGFISWQGAAADVELTRAIHAQAKETAAASGGLMEPMAIPAVGEPDRMVEELDRAVGEYGFRAIMIPSSAGGRPLDDAAFDPLFSSIERHGLLTFMHPTSAFPTDRFGINGMNVLLGWPFETTLAVTRLVFAGTFERHPGLKLILSHSGGNLVPLRGRIDAAYHATGWEAHPYYKAKISKSPTYYLDRLYYDTCSLSVDTVQFVIKVMGKDRVLFGSDFPFDVGDPEGLVAMAALDQCSADVRTNILSGNAERLLSVKQ